MGLVTTKTQLQLTPMQKRIRKIPNNNNINSNNNNYLLILKMG